MTDRFSFLHSLFLHFFILSLFLYFFISTQSAQTKRDFLPSTCADRNDKGQHFHSKHFPKLKYFAHTGHDLEAGTSLTEHSARQSFYCGNYQFQKLLHALHTNYDWFDLSLDCRTSSRARETVFLHTHSRSYSSASSNLHFLQQCFSS